MQSAWVNLNVGYKFQEMWRSKPERQHDPQHGPGLCERGSDPGVVRVFTRLLSSSAVMQYGFCSADPLKVAPNLKNRAYSCFSGEWCGKTMHPLSPHPRFWRPYGVRAKFQSFLRGPGLSHLSLVIQPLLAPASPRDSLPSGDGQSSWKNPNH